MRSIEEIERDLDALQKTSKDPSYWDEPGIAYVSYVYDHAKLIKELRKHQPFLL